MGLGRIIQSGFDMALNIARPVDLNGNKQLLRVPLGDKKSVDVLHYIPNHKKELAWRIVNNAIQLHNPHVVSYITQGTFGPEVFAAATRRGLVPVQIMAEHEFERVEFDDIAGEVGVEKIGDYARVCIPADLSQHFERDDLENLVRQNMTGKARKMLKQKKYGFNLPTFLKPKVTDVTNYHAVTGDASPAYKLSPDIFAGYDAIACVLGSGTLAHSVVDAVSKLEGDVPTVVLIAPDNDGTHHAVSGENSSGSRSSARQAYTSHGGPAYDLLEQSPLWEKGKLLLCTANDNEIREANGLSQELLVERKNELQPIYLEANRNTLFYSDSSEPVRLGPQSLSGSIAYTMIPHVTDENTLALPRVSHSLFNRPDTSTEIPFENRGVLLMGTGAPRSYKDVAKSLDAFYQNQRKAA